jgi:hypothetical protein
MFYRIESGLVYPAPSAGEGNWNPDWDHPDVVFASRDSVKLHEWLLQHPHPLHWIVY